MLITSSHILFVWLNERRAGNTMAIEDLVERDRRAVLCTVSASLMRFAAMALCCVLSSTLCAQSNASKRDTDSTSTSSLRAWDRMMDEQAWQLLPEVREGNKGRVPNWAKAVAVQMPRTAAAMLELDTAQRTQGPLDPILKAKLRWIIAHANRCDYTEALALSDLTRADNSLESAAQRLADPDQWPTSEADAYSFVRMLTTEASAIPDSLFDTLRQKFGDRQVAAMILLAAYGNFQDRLCLGLQIPLEAHGPVPPIQVKFAEQALQRTAILPPNNGQAVYVNSGQALNSPDKQWTSVSYEELQSRLERQRERKPRLPIPSWDKVKLQLPAEMASQPTKIRWSLVTYGYAPELAIPWTTMTRTHWAELPSARILEESLFWVQTRAVNCNYCMGHCEMLLQLAGLDESAVAKRTRMLAETDWGAFPSSEQVAYAYARKLSATPQLLTSQDYATLEKEFGPKQAMSIYVWLCRGLYMTRISDGFQLPLERDNVFGGHASQK